MNILLFSIYVHILIFEALLFSAPRYPLTRNTRSRTEYGAALEYNILSARQVTHDNILLYICSELGPKAGPDSNQYWIYLYDK